MSNTCIFTNKIKTKTIKNFVVGIFVCLLGTFISVCKYVSMCVFIYAWECACELSIFLIVVVYFVKQKYKQN